MALWEKEHPRNEAVAALKAGELVQWKQATGYHQRSKAEAAMYRVKQLIGAKLSLKNGYAKVGKDLPWAKASNRMTGIDMPVQHQIN